MWVKGKVVIPLPTVLPRCFLDFPSFPHLLPPSPPLFGLLTILFTFDKTRILALGPYLSASRMW